MQLAGFLSVQCNLFCRHVVDGNDLSLSRTCMCLLHPRLVSIRLQESAVQSVIVDVPFLVRTHGACPVLAAQMFPLCCSL